MSGKSYRRDRVDKKKPQSNEKISEEKSERQNAAKKSNDDQTPEPKRDTKVQDEIVNVEDEGDAASEDKVGEGGDDVINIEQMEIEKERQERESLDNYLLETKRKADWKEALLSANNEAANNRSDDDKQFYKLDSSLKKNTAFIKKCKMFSESQRESLIKVSQAVISNNLMIFFVFSRTCLA